MKKSDPHKYGHGIPMSDAREPKETDCCDGDPRFRTDYADSMEPSRGPRTYPSVQIIMGPTND